MDNRPRTPRIVLIGGASHTGKSTLGARLARSTGRQHLPTDSLSRHPGRPWRDDDSELPSHVVEHYRDLSVTELLASVSHHYKRNVWPIVRAYVQTRLDNPFDLPLLIEGSAVLPDLVASAGFADTRAVWLTASDRLLREMIATSSRLESRGEDEALLIQKFTSRAVAFNQDLQRVAQTHDQHVVDVGASTAETELAALVAAG